MHNDRIMVLLVGENICHSPRRVQWLHDRGCHCEFAPSYRNACSALSRSEFDVVLSEYQLPDRTAYPLLDWLVGTPATLLFCARVEDGFLWLKMLERGERCLNAPVLRANDSRTGPSADRYCKCKQPERSFMAGGISHVS